MIRVPIQCIWKNINILHLFLVHAFSNANNISILSLLSIYIIFFILIIIIIIRILDVLTKENANSSLQWPIGTANAELKLID